MRTVPVIALTGYLGAGKTSVLNHLLRRPGARVGVVVNDFGDINVDAGLVSGQVDEPASIAGGCLCCLTDAGGLDDALERLAAPRRALDAIFVEASGLADPLALARLIRFSGAAGIRPGGVIEVIDAVEHFGTVDRDPMAATRHMVTSLAIVNKLDRVPDGERTELIERVTQRVREGNPEAQVVGAIGGRVDPALLYDVADDETAGQLDLHDLLLDDHDAHPHQHATSVTVQSSDAVDAGRLLDLLEDPPAGVYRLKGTVLVRWGEARRAYTVNLVGSAIHLVNASKSPERSHLVAIGVEVDEAAVRARLEQAMEPAMGSPSSGALQRLQRYRRLSI